MPSYQENLLKLKLIKLFSSFVPRLYSQEMIERTEFYNSGDNEDQPCNPDNILNQAVFKNFQKEKRYTTKAYNGPYNSIFSIQVLLHFASYFKWWKKFGQAVVI